MNATIEVLRGESKRLRSLADRMDAFASELEGKPPPQVELPLAGGTPGAAAHLFPGLDAEVALKLKPTEFKGMTQHASILKALELYGPQTTRELYIRLNSGGMSFKKPVYISSLLARLKNVVERTDDNRVKLKISADKPPEK
jgi:hypothetical protein